MHAADRNESSGDAAEEEEDHPAERRDDGEDEQPFDDGDRKNDPQDD